MAATTAKTTTFLTDNFLLQTKTAQTLYHEFAKQMPIIDYHCHLPPDEIAQNKQFKNLTEIWLKGDHYKWRAQRTLGVNEHFITGKASDREKFHKWAAVVPSTMRNPLYHWTHMELKNPFGITELLDADNADYIYDACGEQLAHFTTQTLLTHNNVEVVCTTDDPCDNLEHHIAIKNRTFGTKILPAFRPDVAMSIDNADGFRAYVRRLESVVNQTLTSYDDYLTALKSRHDYFAKMGCQLSDHGLETIYAADYTEGGIRKIFAKVLGGKAATEKEILQFKSAMLYEFAVWDFEKGWTQQYHLGAIRNNNSRFLRELGKDIGVDSIGDYSMAVAMSRFFDKLEGENKLAKTIIYNLNPADNEVFATMIGNFQDGSIKGKMQWGSGWWFLDQKDGMTKQINTLSNMGVLSAFIGMITDSRSFLSYPRHEYFRRLLCNIFGDDVKNGELPDDIDWIGSLVQDICYRNARDYFKF
ncbi:MAG: glucuronate isomerase [Saprospiraceae bacterium]|nr:glucuronate isomerase [Saprospiraceae bacterium]